MISADVNSSCAIFADLKGVNIITPGRKSVDSTRRNYFILSFTDIEFLSEENSGASLITSKLRIRASPYDANRANAGIRMTMWRKIGVWATFAREGACVSALCFRMRFVVNLNQFFH